VAEREGETVTHAMNFDVGNSCGVVVLHNLECLRIVYIGVNGGQCMLDMVFGAILCWSIYNLRYGDIGGIFADIKPPIQTLNLTHQHRLPHAPT
jgi:hypothetical protein